MCLNKDVITAKFICHEKPKAEDCFTVPNGYPFLK